MVTRIEFHLKYSVATLTKYVCDAYMHLQTWLSLMIVKCHVHEKAKVRSVLAELLMQYWLSAAGQGGTPMAGLLPQSI